MILVVWKSTKEQTKNTWKFSNLKVLIIGYGSIGQRHFEILKAMQQVSLVDVVSKQDLIHTTTFKMLESIPNLQEYDYFVISSQTQSHYENLKYLVSKVSQKLILVEKPLYDKTYESFQTNNKIFTAYNLRFHPIITALYELLKDETIFYANIMCGQYLPSWRPQRDYKETYSAKKELGGGVLRDLSHELDYAMYLFGEIQKLQTISTRVSDLQINSDDIFSGIGVSQNRVVLNISLDYISKKPIRQLIIHTQTQTIEADLINNKLCSYDVNGKEKIHLENISLERNYTYEQMHSSILNQQTKSVASFEDGLKVLALIDTITYEEL